MWMMGCSDAGDSFTAGRKLRTLVPRPPVPAAVTNPPCLGRIHGAADLLSFNHHLAAMTEQSKRDYFNAQQQQQQVVVSSRWNPTPEQLQTLEELYRRGTRTPSADQIQHITAQLRRYGKIEGKNVFYWFQNHKARERQKRRRQLESASNDDHLAPQNIEKTGVNETGLEVEGTKNWASPTMNCSILPEKGVSIRREQKATNPDCRSEGWEQFNDHTEPTSPPHIINKSLLQQQEQEQHDQDEEERNATWQMMQSFVTSSSSSSTTTCPTTKFIASDDSDPTAAIRTTMLHMRKPFNNYQNHHLGSIFLTPYGTENGTYWKGSGAVCNAANCGSKSQTLELFPLRSSNVVESENAVNAAAAAAAEKESVTPPHKFFEFLPIKN